MVETHLGLDFDRRQGFIVEGEGNTREVLAGARRVEKAQSAAGSIDSVFVTQELAAQPQANLFGEVVRDPQTRRPHGGITRRRKSIGIVKGKIIQLGSKAQLLSRLP